MPTYQPDPRYFDFGNAFFGGYNDALENQRRREMVDVEKRQQGLYEQRYADLMAQQRQQAAQQQQELAGSQKWAADILRGTGLPEEWSRTKEGVEIAQHLVEQQMTPQKPELVQLQGPNGPVYGPKTEGAVPYIEPKTAPKPDLVPTMGPDGRPVYGPKVPGAPVYEPPEKPAKRFRPQDYTNARQKIILINAAKQQLQVVKDTFYGKPDEKTGVKSGGIQNTYSAGLGANYFTSTEGGDKFDAAIDQLRGTIGALTRIPGVGSMSNWEGQLDQAKLPSRGQRESVTEQQIQGLANLIGTLESGYSDILSDVEPGQGSAPPPPSGGTRRKYDRSGKPIGN